MAVGIEIRDANNAVLMDSNSTSMLFLEEFTVQGETSGTRTYNNLPPGSQLYAITSAGLSDHGWDIWNVDTNSEWVYTVMRMLRLLTTTNLSWTQSTANGATTFDYVVDLPVSHVDSQYHENVQDSIEHDIKVFVR